MAARAAWGRVPGVRRVGCVALWVLLLAACSEQSGMSMSGGGQLMGDPIPVPPRPSDAECETVVRDAVLVAQQGRQMLDVEVIGTTLEAADRAARDPDADLSTFGIPLLPSEVAALEEAGVAPDATVPMGSWVGSQPGILNGVVLDADVLTVTVDVPDDDVLARTQCFELAPFAGTVEYRFARPSRMVLEQLRARVQAGRAALAVDGIAVTDAWVDAENGYLVVELARMTEATGMAIIERYGSGVTVTGDNGLLGR